MLPTDDQTPATKGDLSEAVADLRSLIVDSHNSLDKQIKSLAKHVDDALIVMGNIDKRLTADVKDHERRITRLEAVVA